MNVIRRISGGIYFSLLVTGLSLAGCKKPGDPQPPTADLVADSLAKVLIASFPDAANAEFTVVQKDKIWEVNYTRQSKKFYSALTTSKILDSYELISNTVADSLKKNMVGLLLSGGTFSDLRTRVYDTSVRPALECKYTLNDVDYNLRWAGEGVMSFRSYKKFYYRDNQLPKVAIDFLKNKSLDTTSAVTYIDKDNRKFYELTLCYRAYSDQNGVSKIYKSCGTFKELKLDMAPAAVQNYVKTTSYINTFQFDYMIQYEDSDNSLYLLRLKKGYSTAQETYWIYFDSSGAILDISYSSHP